MTVKEQYWFCKEGNEEFIVQGDKKTAEECCQIFGGVILQEAKVTIENDPEGNETVNINK
tara:strand:- start:247 stop:426 length:180 start_codon:yes stop_codon:yes gene_type:complete